MRKIITNLILVLVIVLFCSGCDDDKVGFDDYAGYLNNSMQTVKSITNNVKAYDSSILVYEYNCETLLLEDGNAEVTKAITSLNSSFVLETKNEKSVIENIQSDSLLHINFNRELMDNLNVSDNKITFNLSATNINSFLNSTDLNISGDALCVFNFVDNKINNIKISFTTVSNKNVEANISYLY